MQIAGLPAPLTPSAPDVAAEVVDGSLTMWARPRTDLFVDPDGSAVLDSAPRLLMPVDGDFQLSARVQVPFASTYDAGVLLLWAGDRQWAKLCFELSPAGLPTLVSVVTRGVSDDANGPTAADEPVHLRVSRTGEACAFHASDDGRSWSLVRYFRLDAPVTHAGFEAQSPTGEGCVVRFDTISFVPSGLTDVRDGS
jgi:regulation of enolase protein 1 (concanavalin A-like superfamily)